MVSRFPELFLQVSEEPPNLIGQFMVRVNESVLSIKIPSPAVPLIVLPLSCTLSPSGNRDVLNKPGHPNAADAGI